MKCTLVSGGFGLCILRSELFGTEESKHIQSVIRGHYNRNAFPKFNHIYAVIQRQTAGASDIATTVHEYTHGEGLSGGLGSIGSVKIYIDVEIQAIFVSVVGRK